MRTTVAFLIGCSIELLSPAPSARWQDAPSVVASIKRNQSNVPAAFDIQPGGRLIMINGTFGALLRTLFPTTGAELVGAPDWLDTERYDVNVKVEGNPTLDQMRDAMRAMFAERLNLSSHFEMREHPVYALRPARRDGRLGPRLRRSTIDCAAAATTDRVNAPPACSLHIDGGRMTSKGVLIGDLVRNLGTVAGRVVIDQTGLKDRYELTLEYSPTLTPGPTDPRPSVFTAVREQLGLQLVADRAPLRTLVIERIERPSPD